jgi:hypothetical protein
MLYGTRISAGSGYPWKNKKIKAVAPLSDVLIRKTG